MSAYLTALTGAGTVVAVGLTIIARTLRPTGQHRAPSPLFRSVLDEQSLDELLGPWPEPPHGAVVAQEWRDCPDCGTAEPCVRNRDGWLCGHCLHPITTVVGDLL